jgi:serine/threonine protein kinase
VIGRTISNRYKVYDKVGSGGMAEVFLARDLQSGEIVALKILREQFTEGEDYIERFEREAKSATKLNHPNICLSKDYGQEDDVYYMVMEYVEGKTLSSVIEEKGPLSIQETVSYVIQISKALEHAYERGLVAHRDIKSQNIMVTASGQVKLMDFGIAKSKDFATMTSVGSFVGTPEYMSPEQAQGEKVDKRSDIYSLGVVFYEALAGEVPFESDTPWGVLNMHINKEPFPLINLRKDIPKDLVDLIVRMMAKDLDERFQNPRELIATLEAVMETIKLPRGSKIKKKKIPRSNPKRARKIKKAILIIFILLLIGGGVYTYLEYFAPKPVNISVDAEPDGAIIQLKGPKDTEYKSFGIADSTLEKIYPGKYEMRISMDGYVPKETSFMVKSGVDMTLDQIVLSRPGKLEVTTSEIDWGGVEEIPSPKKITIKNTGESPITVKRSQSGDWFTMEESELNIPAGESVSFPITVNSSDVEPGSNYNGIVTLEPEVGDNVTINVKLQLLESEVVVIPDPAPVKPSPGGGGDNNQDNSGSDITSPPTTGSVRITCDVNTAVMIDGKPADTTPCTLTNLSPGTHTISTRGSRKYKAFKGEVTIVAGKTATLKITLELK